MSTSYTTRAALQKSAFADRNWHLTILATADALDAIESIGSGAVITAETPSASRNVKVAAFSYTKADGTIASYAGTSSFTLTAASTRYVYLTDAGTLTDGASWPAGVNYVRLAVVVVGASTITSITDARVPWQSTGAGGGSYLSLAGGTMSGSTTYAASANLVFDTVTGSKIGTATTQKIGFYNATPVVQPASASQTALTDSSAGSTANTTLAALTTAGTFTISTGGSASDVLSAITLTTSMTGSTGGTADGAWQSIPDPADAPATADALRDDLVANALPALRNNFAEVSTELATNRAALSVIRDSINSLASKQNTALANISTLNDDIAKIAKLLNQLRSDLVTLGLIKGSA